MGAAERAPLTRHPEGCAFCPAELLGLERDRNGDPLCQTCPHLRTGTCQLCGGSGWIPGITMPVGPLDELPCPECSAACEKRQD
jgi:hypothetical protein